MSQLTFRDDDVSNLKNFLEFVRDKGKFQLDMAEAVQLTKYVQFLQEHIRKVNAHVMELARIIEPAPSESSESTKKSKSSK